MKSEKTTSKKRKSTRKIKGAASEKRRIIARAAALKVIENPSMAVGTALAEVGASKFLAHNPQHITQSKEWQELLDEYLPNGEALEAHRGLLRASHIDHMVFADGARDEKECAVLIAERNAKLAEGENPYTREDFLTDDDIRAMLAEKGCQVRRISRTDRSRHVYFWSADNRARKDGLDMLYKLRGHYAADKAAVAFSLAALAKLRDGGNTPQLENAPRAAQIESEPDAPQLPRAV